MPATLSGLVAARAHWLALLAVVALTACEAPVSNEGPDPASSAGEEGGNVAVAGASVPGLAPPPGRTAAERQARKDYFRGPRGDEF